MKEQTKIIAALLVGAAAGAVVGLLLAPKEGSELRGDIADYVNDLAEKSKAQVRQTAENVRGYGNDVYDRAKSKVSDAVSSANDYKDRMVDNVRSTVNDYKDQALDYGANALNSAKSNVKDRANDLNNTVQNA